MTISQKQQKNLPPHDYTQIAKACCTEALRLPRDKRQDFLYRELRLPTYSQETKTKLAELLTRTVVGYGLVEPWFHVTIRLNLPDHAAILVLEHYDLLSAYAHSVRMLLREHTDRLWPFVQTDVAAHKKADKLGRLYFHLVLSSGDTELLLTTLKEYANTDTIPFQDISQCLQILRSHDVLEKVLNHRAVDFAHAHTLHSSTFCQFFTTKKQDTLQLVQPEPEQYTLPLIQRLEARMHFFVCRVFTACIEIGATHNNKQDQTALYGALELVKMTPEHSLFRHRLKKACNTYDFMAKMPLRHVSETANKVYQKLRHQHLQLITS